MRTVDFLAVVYVVQAGVGIVLGFAYFCIGWHRLTNVRFPPGSGARADMRSADLYL
jgi:hypothetical protein